MESRGHPCFADKFATIQASINVYFTGPPPVGKSSPACRVSHNHKHIILVCLQHDTILAARHRLSERATLISMPPFPQTNAVAVMVRRGERQEKFIPSRNKETASSPMRETDARQCKKQTAGLKPTPASHKLLK